MGCPGTWTGPERLKATKSFLKAFKKLHIYIYTIKMHFKANNVAFKG